jgi:hypothetical protein
MLLTKSRINLGAIVKQVHFSYTKDYSERTCYKYHSDLGIWGRWLEEEW